MDLLAGACTVTAQYKHFFHQKDPVLAPPNPHQYSISPLNENDQSMRNSGLVVHQAKLSYSRYIS